MNYSELRQKDVINICDGRRLGRPIDLVLNENACIEAMIISGGERCGFFGMLKPEREGNLIPWRSVRQIGDDVILVEVDSENCNWEIKREFPK